MTTWFHKNNCLVIAMNAMAQIPILMYGDFANNIICKSKGMQRL